MKELIKEIRTSLNMSQTELAELLNISFATVNRWENGRAVPNKLAQSALYELCKTNNVPVYDMVIEKIKSNGVNVIIYEPTINENTYNGIEVIHDLKLFKEISDLIIVNRIDSNLDDVKEIIYSRDIFSRD